MIIGEITLGPAHAVQLLAIGAMLRAGDLHFSGASIAGRRARETLIDISQEIALQAGGEPAKP